MADKTIHFLVDYENVSNGGLSGAEYLLPGDSVTVFYSNASKKVQKSSFENLTRSGCTLELVKLVKCRNNALDFYIAVKTGQLRGQGYRGTIAIVSNDQGFRSVKEYCQNYLKDSRLVQGTSIERCIVSANLNDERMKTVARNMEPLDMEIEYAKYEERRKLRAELERVLVNANKQEIMEFQKIVEDGGERKKVIYLGSLRTFGRARGLELYRQFGNLGAEESEEAQTLHETEEPALSVAEAD